MKLLKITGSAVLLLMLAGCTKVPMTGRRQIKLIPSAQIQALSYSNYSEIMKQGVHSNNQHYISMVQNSGNRIKAAVETYMKRNKRYARRIRGYQWEFNVLEGDQINAWCMPGGKVAFYTGIMPVCRTELGTAVVMGHEVAHAIAGHGNERMSQGLAATLGGLTLSVALSKKPEKTRNLFLQAYGVGTQVGVMLPFSRTHESEADKMGLMFMAMAGYDPREAVNFWERMSDATQGAHPPVFLSTHPPSGRRIENLKKWMPEALRYYKQAKK